MKTLLFAIVALLLLSQTAWAQTAADCTGAPTTTVVSVSPTPSVIFTKSADHDTVVQTTTPTPVLSSYAVAVCRGTTLVSQTNIGKPTPNTAGDIQTPIPSPALITRNTPHYLVIYAIGPGGTSKSGPVVPFVMAGPPAAAGNVRIVP